MAVFDRFFRITMRSCEKRCRWAARVSPIERTSYGRGCIGRKFYAGSADAVCRFMRVLGGGVLVARVSLSDWLALRARVRGFKNPRLLRDRPTDGAA